MQPELSHFIWLFLGLDRADFSQADIDELDQRIKALPARLQLSCKNRPNLGKVFLELKENEAFMEEIKRAVKNRLKVADNPVDAKKVAENHQGANHKNNCKWNLGHSEPLKTVSDTTNSRIRDPRYHEDRVKMTQSARNDQSKQPNDLIGAQDVRKQANPLSKEHQNFDKSSGIIYTRPEKLLSASCGGASWDEDGKKRESMVKNSLCLLSYPKYTSDPETWKCFDTIRKRSAIENLEIKSLN